MKKEIPMWQVEDRRTEAMEAVAGVDSKYATLLDTYGAERLGDLLKEKEKFSKDLKMLREKYLVHVDKYYEAWDAKDTRKVEAEKKMMIKLFEQYHPFCEGFNRKMREFEDTLPELETVEADIEKIGKPGETEKQQVEVLDTKEEAQEKFDDNKVLDKLAEELGNKASRAASTAAGYRPPRVSSSGTMDTYTATQQAKAHASKYKGKNKETFQRESKHYKRLEQIVKSSDDPKKVKSSIQRYKGELLTDQKKTLDGASTFRKIITFGGNGLNLEDNNKVKDLKVLIESVDSYIGRIDAI